MTGVDDHAKALADEARRASERRLVVVPGEPEASYAAVETVLDAAGIEPADRVVVADGDVGVPGRRLDPQRSGELLGTTQDAAVVDLHPSCHPDVLGRVVGAVDGGGLLVLCVPPLADWPDRRDGFDATMAVPPYAVDDVAGRFRERLVATLQGRPGVAIVDADAGTVEKSGLTDPEPAPDRSPPEPPDRALFEDAAYRACLTPDQARAVHALEALYDPDRTVVVEADRGRGKSSAAGLAAACLARRGRDVLATAPRRSGAAEVLARARELLETLGDLDADRSDDGEIHAGDGSIVYRRPAEAVDARADVAVVDEAAALPVHVLDDLLEVARSAAFVTTIHGYEGAGRGFSVRFRDRLDDRGDVVDVAMDDPIRYGADDPVEDWAFDALLLDAEPAPAGAVADATVDDATYRRIDADELAGDPDRLRDVFGLLVLAHYRTRPGDLARLLDAPNLHVRALTVDDRVVSVALLAEEGGLGGELRESMYEGERVAGNMIPDVLTSQLRDPDAGRPTGWRVVRIATHQAARRSGLGSHLLDRIRDEADVDWLGTSYGATPDLLGFWADNGYRTVHLATSRNPASGEHAAVMLAPVTGEGRALLDRSTDWLIDRIADVLADALSELDADVVRAALSAVDGPVEPAVGDRGWRLVASSAFGPGIYDVHPGPFREVVVQHLVEQRADLDAEAERLLVRKALQLWPWQRIAATFDLPGTSAAMRRFADALKPLVVAYGDEAAKREAERYRRSED